MNKAIEISNLH